MLPETEKGMISEFTHLVHLVYSDFLMSKFHRSDHNDVSKYRTSVCELFNSLVQKLTRGRFADNQAVHCCCFL